MATRDDSDLRLEIRSVNKSPRTTVCSDGRPLELVALESLQSSTQFNDYCTLDETVTMLRLSEWYLW